jgi:peptide/nickel transport system permease protein
VKTYIAQRLGIAILTLFGMSIVIFVLLRLAPGDIVDVLFSAAGYVNPVEKQAILKELGIDKPYWRSTSTGSADLPRRPRQVLPLRPAGLADHPPARAGDDRAGHPLHDRAVVLGVPTGVISAVRQDSTLDYVLRVFSLAGLSMPSFWLGMVIILRWCRGSAGSRR